MTYKYYMKHHEFSWKTKEDKLINVAYTLFWNFKDIGVPEIN